MQIITLTGRLIWPKKNVSKATIIKLAPPAKSVNLSNLKVAAIMKNIICINTVTMALMAKWSTSSTCNIIQIVCFNFLAAVNFLFLNVSFLVSNSSGG